MSRQTVLEARDISKHFVLKGHGGFLGGGHSVLHAVDDVSISIDKGEAVGLVGESGCGKSTLARIMCRLIDPTTGTLSISGRPITDISSARFVRSDLRRKIQMVFQDAGEIINPRFSVFDVIADPLRQLVRPKSRAEVAARVREAARAVNLAPDLLDRFPHQLSGGQKARVGIARAMVVDPELLVLDEPTSALDVSVQATVLQLLARLRQEADVALLFVSHDLNVVRLLCSRILVMYLGRIVESGPTEEIFNRPRHPYTKALLSAVPTLRPDRATERVKLEGEPLSPINPDPRACRMVGRCPYQQARCTAAEPHLEPCGPAHAVRCHFPLD
jgi:oligopeptide/dipeptide ABC transporter ATP-binding protein